MLRHFKAYAVDLLWKVPAPHEAINHRNQKSEVFSEIFAIFAEHKYDLNLQLWM